MVVRSGSEEGRLGLAEIAVLVLLLVGGFLMVVGWLAGLGLLWASRAWTVPQKLVGTLVVPFGLAAAVPALLVFSEMVSCGDPSGRQSLEPGCTAAYSLQQQVVWGAILGACTVGPVFTTVFLARRVNRPLAPEGYQSSSGAA